MWGTGDQLLQGTVPSHHRDTGRGGCRQGPHKAHTSQIPSGFKDAVLVLSTATQHRIGLVLRAQQYLDPGSPREDTTAQAQGYGSGWASPVGSALIEVLSHRERRMGCALAGKGEIKRVFVRYTERRG